MSSGEEKNQRAHNTKYPKDIRIYSNSGNLSRVTLAEYLARFPTEEDYFAHVPRPLFERLRKNRGQDDQTRGSNLGANLAASQNLAPAATGSASATPAAKVAPTVQGAATAPPAVPPVPAAAPAAGTTAPNAWGVPLPPPATQGVAASQPIQVDTRAGKGNNYVDGFMKGMAETQKLWLSMHGNPNVGNNEYPGLPPPGGQWAQSGPPPTTATTDGQK